MKQLFHLRSTWQRRREKRCVGALLLFRPTEQRLQPCFGTSVRPGSIQASEKRSVLECQEIAKAMTSTTSSMLGNGQA